MATNTYWVGGDGSWMDSSKWAGLVPGKGVIANMRAGGTASVLLDGLTHKANGLVVNDPGAILHVKAGLTLGIDSQSGERYSFDVTSGKVIIEAPGGINVERFITSATGTVDVINGGTYNWKASGSSQIVNLGDGYLNKFLFETDFGGTIRGLDSNFEKIQFNGTGLASVSITIGINEITFNAANKSYVIHLDTPGIDYDSSNLIVSGNQVTTTITQLETNTPRAVVTGVRATTADGIYTKGKLIDIVVTFDQQVDVKGIPELKLETGDVDRVAKYLNGSGSSTLTFQYEVKDGDTSADLNYLSNSALTGAIKNAGLNVKADLNLPPLQGAGSLAANNAIVIDAQKPSTLVLSLVVDSGTADGVTRDARIKVDGQEDGATLKFSVDGGEPVEGLPALQALLVGDKEYKIQALQVDVAGNESDSVEFKFTLDTSVNAPSQPVLATASDSGAVGDGLTNLSPWNFSGAAENGVLVTLYEGANAVGSATATDGTWTIQYIPQPSDGAKVFTAKATDSADNTSAASATTTVVYDITKPTVSFLANPDKLKAGEQSNIEISFKEDIGNTLDDSEIKVSGGVLEITSKTPTKWTGTFTPNDGETRVAEISIADGVYADAAENLGVGGSISIAYDTEIPAVPSKPALDQTDDSGVKGDGVTSSAAPQLVGKAEANSTVSIYVAGRFFTSTKADASGDWKAPLGSLNEGNYEYTATATDSFGNQSPASEPFSLTIDRQAPTVEIKFDGPSLVRTGETRDVTFDFSEDPGADWDGAASTEVQGGKLSNFSGGGPQRFATFTPDVGLNDVEAKVAMKANTFEDAAGNKNALAETIFRVDTLDPEVSISTATVEKSEGNTGETEFTFTVTRSKDISGLLSVGYVVSGSGANPADASDFAGKLNGEISFNGESNTATITVLVKGDASVEANEQFTVSLVEQDHVIFKPISANATILNDDVATGGGGTPSTPIPNTPTPTPNDGFDGSVPALVVSSFVEGVVPGTLARLESLSNFAEEQFLAYQAKGVLNPGLGPYEALGLGFSETTEFQDKYGALTEPSFILKAYENVFGRQATGAQADHFQAQIDYFEALYASVNIPEARAEMMAKGAALGQMLGFAVLGEGDTQPYLAQAQAFLADAADGVVEMGKPLAFYELH